MSDEEISRPAKRKDITPDAKQDKEKVVKQYESITPHPSVLNIQGSPVSTSPLNITKKLEMAGLCEARKPDLETFYSLLTDLSSRVTSLEDQLQKKDEELFNLRRDHASLHQQFSEFRAENKSSFTKDDSQFLEVLKEEVPKLSDHVAEHESKIVALNSNLKDLTDARDVNMDENENQGQINEEVQKLKDARKEDHQNFVKVTRKNHLEGDQRDQYSMRDTIRVTGVPFKKGEDTNELISRIAHSIGVTVNKDDISVSHRTGKRRGNNPRAIVCRFTRRDVKHQIMRNRKNARHITHDDDGNPVKIFIDEKLTTMRANVCRYLREQKVDHHTWDGKIFIPNQDRRDDADSEWILLDRAEDWIKWDKSEKIKMDLGIYSKF